ncbi:MAG: FtsH protease activity modulator HflK [Proteobacteria bacterium]|nr:FtsH protease activity modulator HflK [Pseudomonadota bacterium]MCP4916618.1 FtsH protease activity modulator HflK [Pseudomonadota bacterium]
MSRWLLAGAGVVGALWLLSGAFLVDPGEQAVVFRFGAVDRAVGPGFQVRAPWPIESQVLVTTGEVRRAAADKRRMLTGDTNLVDLELVTQYTVSDPAAFLISTQDPDAQVTAAVASVATDVVATIEVDTLLTTGRTALQQRIQADAQLQLDALDSGIRLVAVEVADLTPPPAVVDAFNDVSSARGDRETLALAAEAYSSDLLPRTRGEGSSEVELARSDAARRESQAHGETDRFEALLPAWRKAPAATREQLITSTWANVDATIRPVHPDAEVVWNPED